MVRLDTSTFVVALKLTVGSLKLVEMNHKLISEEVLLIPNELRMRIHLEYKDIFFRAVCFSKVFNDGLGH